MKGYKFGIEGISSITAKPAVKSKNKQNLFSARVKKIILDDPQNLGSIFFLPLLNTDSNNENDWLQAKSFFPNITTYPLINEIVLITYGPGIGLNKTVTDNIYYYFNSFNIWNSTHHNAFPNDSTSSVFLGNTFVERNNIHNLLPFEGDTIIEGRWGQSLRFGSTVKGKNAWSSRGQNGDPITIIMNGQSPRKDESIIPTIEDIKGDQSSLYLTSTQIISVSFGSKNFKSFEDQNSQPNISTLG